MGVDASFSPSKVVKGMVLLTAECDHDPEASVQLHSALAALPGIVTNLATPLTSVLTSGTVVDMSLPVDNGAPVVASHVFFGVLKGRPIRAPACPRPVVTTWSRRWAGALSCQNE